MHIWLPLLSSSAPLCVRLIFSQPAQPCDSVAPAGLLMFLSMELYMQAVARTWAQLVCVWSLCATTCWTAPPLWCAPHIHKLDYSAAIEHLIDTKSTLAAATGAISAVLEGDGHTQQSIQHPVHVCNLGHEDHHRWPHSAGRSQDYGGEGPQTCS